LFICIYLRIVSVHKINSSNMTCAWASKFITTHISSNGWENVVGVYAWVQKDDQKYFQKTSKIQSVSVKK